MENFDALKRLIEENRDNLNMGEFGAGDGPSTYDIEKAQKCLNVVFPPSYLWWLANYGGGEIMGDEIYSIYPPIDNSIPAGDIVYRNELNRKNGWSNKNQLIIQENDMGEMFYFDCLCHRMKESTQYLGCEEHLMKNMRILFLIFCEGEFWINIKLSHSIYQYVISTTFVNF